MSEDFNKEKVLGRVRKMMTLANDAAAAEGERDNAIRMAHATLAKYNLSMAEAEAHGQPVQEQRVNNALSVRDYAWMRAVANWIAKLYFCEFFYVRNPVTKHAKYYFIGRESNARVAMEMASYVMASIDREAQDTARKYGHTPKGEAWRSFCKGAGIKIERRCAEMIAEALQPTVRSTGTSLVLASVYEQELKANAEYIEQDMGVKVRIQNSKQRMPSAHAFSLGMEYGDKVNLRANLIKEK